MNYLKVIYIIIKHLPVKGINRKITSRIRTFNCINYDGTRRYSEFTISISDNLHYAKFFSNTQYFNLWY